jgi:hypothetical protein
MSPAEAKSPHALTKLQHFTTFREYRVREHELLNHRITWNLAIQGFLFATYGFSLQKLAEVQANAVGEGATIAQAVNQLQGISQLSVLLRTIPWLGMFMSIFVLLAVLGAKLSLEQLGEDWKKIEFKYPEEPFLPSPAGGGVPMAVRLGFYAPLAIPAIFVAAWFYILLPH